jgi:ABC-2 type transport system permease protein
LENVKQAKKRGFVFHVKLYFKIIAQDIKTKMNYRADFIISNFAQVLHHISGFITFWLIFQNFPSVAGWNYEEMLFFYGFSLIAYTPTQCFLDNNWSLRGHIYSGDFIKYKIRPINTFFYFMSEVFDLKGFGQLVAGTAILAYAWINLGIGVSLSLIGLLLLNLTGASLIMAAMMNMAAALIFWTTNSGFAMLLMVRFRDYARYPVTIFGDFLRFIFTFVIPMAFISYYPSLTFLRPADVPLLTWFSPLIGAAFFAVSYFVWMAGANRYSGTGS